MRDRQIILRCIDGKWSAAYADQPEEQFYGVTMQDALDRLTSASRRPDRVESEPDHAMQ